MTSATQTRELVLFNNEYYSFDLDQCQDIVNHGMAQGVSGFTYNHELEQLFNENHEEIEDYLNQYCNDIFGDGTYIQHYCEGCMTVSDVKTQAVWAYVECMCHSFLCKHHPDY